MIRRCAQQDNDASHAIKLIQRIHLTTVRFIFSPLSIIPIITYNHNSYLQQTMRSSQGMLTAVLGGVVVVDVQVPRAHQVDVEATVLGQLRHHVVQEPQARAHLALAAAVQVHLTHTPTNQPTITIKQLTLHAERQRKYCLIHSN